MVAEADPPHARGCQGDVGASSSADGGTLTWVSIVVASTTMATSTNTFATDPIQTLPSNSFSFALHNFIDHIPQRELFRLDSPVLDVVSLVVHDDVHSEKVEQLHLISREVVQNPKVSDVTTALSDVVEQEHPQSRELVESPKVSYATATNSSSVTHDDVLERSIELISSTCMEVSPVHTDHHVVEHDDVHSGSPADPLRASILATVTEERSHIESLVQDAASDSLVQIT